MIRVLDASVVVKWFVPEDPASTARAAAILDEVLLAPRVFARRLRSTADTEWAMEHLFRLGLAPLRFDRSVARTVAQAMAAGMTGYDATYYAFAAEVGGRWVTFDQRAGAQAPDQRIIERL